MIHTGLEQLMADRPPALRVARLGLLMNQASVDARFRYAHHELHRRFPGQLRALFSPQHGFWSELQDNMIESPHELDPDLQVPIYSLYSETRKPQADMLRDIDILLVDLQDVGTRVYTFIWTISYCLEACAAAGVPVMILDRPNPLGGCIVEGPQLDPACASFVGRAPLPMRHGLTLAELTLVVNELLAIGAEVIPQRMSGWERDMHWQQTGRVWVPPSPNLPRIEGVDLYPGQVLLEGTLLSEGRGTTVPFEICGAPHLDLARILPCLNAYELEGIVWRPIHFEPTFQKHARQRCRGFHWHVTDRRTFRSYRATVALLSALVACHGDEPLWREPPYEYEADKMPIDILAGSSALRMQLEQSRSPRPPSDATRTPDRLLSRSELDALSVADVSAWRQTVAAHLLYGTPEMLRA